MNVMKRITFTLIAFFAFFVFISPLCTYAAKVTSGSLNCLKGENYLAVSLDCSKAKYKKTRPLEEFLWKAPRIENWEQESLKCFIEVFNENTYQPKAFNRSENKGRFELIIIPLNINGSGGINAIANLVNIKTGNIEATIDFSAEGDDDDTIALRDPMKEAGEQIGKLISKAYKKWIYQKP